MIPQYCIRIRNIKVFLSTHCCYTTWERPLPLGCGSTAWWKHRCIRSFLSNTFSPLWNLAAYHSGWISISFILSSVSSLRWSRPPGKAHLYVYYAFLTHTYSFFWHVHIWCYLLLMFADTKTRDPYVKVGHIDKFVGDWRPKLQGKVRSI